MSTPDAMATEKERLYESSSLRDDLNDAEATILLEWGESQLQRLAQDFPDEFEAKARFLRQLLKNINRFVGQREFNEMQGQLKYMSKVCMYLEPLGWEDISSDDLFAELPDDKANMSGNLIAIIRVLSPKAEAQIDVPTEDNPIMGTHLDLGAEIRDTLVEPIISQAQSIAEQLDTENEFRDTVQDRSSDITDVASFNDTQTNDFLEAYSDYDEENEQ